MITAKGKLDAGDMNKFSSEMSSSAFTANQGKNFANAVDFDLNERPIDFSDNNVDILEGYKRNYYNEYLGDKINTIYQDTEKSAQNLNSLKLTTSQKQLLTTKTQRT